MRRGIVSFALAIVVGATLSPAPGRAAQTPAGIATDPILQPPIENGKPLDVVLGLHVINIAAIDEVSEQFRLDGYLYARWIDQRLAYTPDGPDDRMRNYAIGADLGASTGDDQRRGSPLAQRNRDHGKPGRHGEVRGALPRKPVVEVRAETLPVRSAAADSHHPSLPGGRPAR